MKLDEDNLGGRENNRWRPDFRIFRFTLLLICLLGGVASGRGDEPAATLTVLNFQNANPGDGYDWLQRAFPDMLLIHFAQQGAYTVVERERMQALLDELKLGQTGVTAPGDAAKFAGIAQVQKVVYGHYSVENGRLRATAFIFDATLNTVDAVAMAEGELNSLCEIERQLFANLLGRLGTPLTDRDRLRLLCVVSSSLTAVAHFYEGLAAFDGGDYPAALVQFQKAGRQDPQYGEARLWAARMYSYLGQPAQAVVELRQFTSDLPEHSLVPQARLRTGLALLQELQQPRLAATEFERLIAMSPAVQEAPAKLRQAHWEEYVALYRGNCSYPWFPPEQQKQFQAGVQKLETLGSERARPLDIFVEGWYRLGQCQELLGEPVKAFAAYDQGRAVCRWLLLDRSGLTDRLYNSTYELYQQLLRTKGITLPVPDWVWPIKAGQSQTILDENQDEMFRYLLGRAWRGPHGYPAVVLLAPSGRQFSNLTAHAYGAGAAPKCVWPVLNIKDFGRRYYAPPGENAYLTNCLTSIIKFTPSTACRACRLDVWGPAGSNEGEVVSVSVSASDVPWTGVIYKNPPQTTKAIVYRTPTNAILRIDGVVAKPMRDGYIVSPLPPEGSGYYVTPGKHRFELKDEDRRTDEVAVDFELGSIHQVFISLDCPWKDTGVRLPSGWQPDLCRALDGQYWLVYVTKVPVEPGQLETGEDIWLSKSWDFRQWSKPIRLPINSPQADTEPRLTPLPDGRMQLTFMSDRRQPGPRGVYLAESINGREWSIPRRLPDGSPMPKDTGAGKSPTLPITGPLAQCSRKIQLPDGGFGIAASQIPRSGFDPSTYIYVATAEALQAATNNLPLKVDHP